CAQHRNLVLPPGPGEVDVFAAHRLRVVVGKERRMLVVALAAPLEPARERGVQLRPPCLRQARVGHLPRERVLDRVLALAAQRGAGAAPDEVALGEQAKVRRTADELVDWPCPEDAAD